MPGLIAGVCSASLGSSISSCVFISSNEFFLQRYFSEFDIIKGQLIDCIDWKSRLLRAYIYSDILKLIAFIPFEARKQRIQLSQTSSQYSEITFLVNILRSFPYLIIRDTLTRCLSLGLYLTTLQVHYNPNLKYSTNLIQEHIMYCKKTGKQIDKSNYYDYSNFECFSSFNLKFFCIVASCSVATVVTQPLDVIATKYLTQTDSVYKICSGPTQIFKTEGAKKLLFSGISPRLFFNIISALNVITFYDLIYRSLLSRASFN